MTNSSPPPSVSTSTSTSSTSTTTTTSTFRDVSLDLSNKHAKKALEVLLQMEKRRTKVRHARVFSSNPTGYESPQGIKTMTELFELLSRLPNLKTLTVSFPFPQTLPLQALCFLSGAPRLKSLQLDNVSLQTEDDDQEEDKQEQQLEQQLELWNKTGQLQELTLQHCRGTKALQKLLSKGLPSSIRRLTIANTPIGHAAAPAPASTSSSSTSASTTSACSTESCACSTTGTLQAIIQNNPQLQGLRLWDVPNLQDNHVQVLADQILLMGDKTLIQELEVTSSILGPPSGEAVANLLIQHRRSVKIEHLKLHLDWEDCGSTVALLLLTNKQIKHLDIRLYGDDDNVRADATAIAHALQNTTSSSLRRLRVCMELEPEQVAGDEDIMQAFEQMLATNDTLKYLVLDDSLEDFALSAEMEAKLKLNRSGAPRLWKRNTPPSHAHFVQALINQRNDVNTLYHILSNQPTLCSYALMAPAKQQQQQDADEEAMLSKSSSLNCSTGIDFSQFAPGRKTLSSLSPKRTTYKARKFLKKSMKKVFASSA